VRGLRGEAFAGGAVAWGDALSLVSGKAGMVKTVQNVKGGLADAAAGVISTPYLIARGGD